MCSAYMFNTHVKHVIYIHALLHVQHNWSYINTCKYTLYFGCLFRVSAYIFSLILFHMLCFICIVYIYILLYYLYHIQYKLYVFCYFIYFSYTFDKIQEFTDQHWYFQRYSLIKEYHDVPALVPPLIALSHIYLIIRALLHLCCPNIIKPPDNAFSKFSLISKNKNMKGISNFIQNQSLLMLIKMYILLRIELVCQRSINESIKVIHFFNIWRFAYILA